ncbi:SDR family NAD(P)-dependent oxidoreductase [Catellatospora coxensis]|uniref:Short-chain dehydrogenase n=1 Tax=Catellatospora coxensis TaxID=310354 RepID=A0A8J3LAL6_9ACTN|nr:SDR family oxidoreductase [Catellatospora coxensis]GIG11541.1 short-chain dehydrogenase [Catellatospora coxensis]
MEDLSGQTVFVVGASRGLGRGAVGAFLDAGARVIALARDTSSLRALAGERPELTVEAADAADPGRTAELLKRHDPDVLVLVAGALPVLRPLTHQTWETFSVNWHSDVRIAYTWLREALLRPLRPGSRVIVVSSGAALRGSPISGGYAGAKATVRFLAEYAAEESARAGLGLTVTTVLPQLTGETALGRPAVEAYAERAGISVEEFQTRLGPALTPQLAGAALLRLAAGTASGDATAYLLTGQGLQPVR